MRAVLPVCVAYAHPGTVRAEFADSLFALLNRYQVKSRICMQSGPRIATTRNNLIRAFLDDTTAEWLWMVDTDMTFEPDVLERLLACDVPVVGALCFARDKDSCYPTIYTQDGKGFIERMYDYPQDELLEVDATGAACLLIHRSALERIGVNNKEPYRWFADTSFEGREIGEDITFCLRCWQLNIPVHVHSGVRVGHIKDVIIDEQTYLGGRACGEMTHTEPSQSSAPA